MKLAVNVVLFCCCLVRKSCPTLLWLMDCSPPVSVRWISWARILEWVAVSFSRGSFWPRDQTWVSRIAGRLFTVWATREAPIQFIIGLGHRKLWIQQAERACLWGSLVRVMFRNPNRCRPHQWQSTPWIVGCGFWWMRWARPKQQTSRPSRVSQSTGWTAKFRPSGAKKAGGLGMTETRSRAISGLSPFLRAAESSGHLGPSNLVYGR